MASPASTTPSAIAPPKAPRTEPSPAMAVMAKALRVSGGPWNGWMASTGLISAPARPVITYAEREGHRVNGGDVDTDDPGRLSVLGRGPDALAEAGMARETG